MNRTRIATTPIDWFWASSFAWKRRERWAFTAAAFLFVNGWVSGQAPAATEASRHETATGTELVQYRHLRTYGSKQGIQPPRILNHRLAKLALGEDDPPYEIAAPSGVVVDAQKRVWIADGGNPCIHIFDPASGSYRRIRRAGDMLLQGPAGISIDYQGRIYVSDAPTGNVFVFDKEGEYARTLTPKKRERLLESPTAIAIAENGRTVYVLDPPRHVVVALNQEGESIGTFGLSGELNLPVAISVVGDDVYVLDTGLRRVRIFTAIGRLRGDLKIEGVPFPSAFAYDPGRLWHFVGNPSFGVVQAFDREGRNTSDLGSIGDAVNQVRKIDALYIDSQQRVYVIDSHNGKVLVFGD